MKLSETTSSILLVTAVACAVVSTALAIRGPQAPPRVERPLPQDQDISGWEEYNTGGHLIGDSGAVLTIVEFSDFQCPYCGSAARGVLRYMREQYPREFAIRYREAPNPSHSLALPLARAAACAGDQGRFVQMHDQIFEHQEELGTIPISMYAERAGVPDMEEFDRCTSDSTTTAGILLDQSASKALQIRGTPTFLIAGKLVAGIPDTSRLVAEMKRASAQATSAP